MKLYYTKGACSLACRIVINELGLACDYVSVDLKTKRTEKDEDFLKVNPKGAVPVLVINSDVLTENAVIQQYLADQNNAVNLLPPVPDMRRYHILEWLNYVATEVHKGFGPFFNPDLPADIKETIFTPLIKKKLAYVSNALKNKRYLLGDEFTLPDAYMFVMLFWASKFRILDHNFPELERYYQELKERPAIQKSLKEEDLHT